MAMIKAWRKGHVYIGSGSRELRLQPSEWSSPFKAAQYTRPKAIELYKALLEKDSTIAARLERLSAKVLACHCRGSEACHADAIIELFSFHFPRAYLLGSASGPPPSAAAAYAAAEAREIAGEAEEAAQETDVTISKHDGWGGEGPPCRWAEAR